MSEEKKAFGGKSAEELLEVAAGQLTEKSYSLWTKLDAERKSGGVSVVVDYLRAILDQDKLNCQSALERVENSCRSKGLLR